MLIILVEPNFKFVRRRTMTSANALSASLEDYLEAILLITKTKGAARSKDISKHLSVKGPSVTGALRLLAEKDLVHYAPYDVVTLTAQGRAVAENIVKRHEALHSFLFEVLQLDEQTAESTACQLEHAISESVLERLVRFVQFVKDCPRGGNNWVNGFAHNCDSGASYDVCEPCIKQCMENLSRYQKGGETDTMQIKLSEIQPGERGAIESIEAAGTIRRRLLDMGATPGTVVEVERVAPMGDPIDVKIKGYHLSLRKEEAAGIVLKKIR